MGVHQERYRLMASTDYQLEYRGLVMGLGTNYSLLAVEGLEDDEVRMGDATLPRRGGDVAGLHVPAGREIILDISVKGEKDSQTLRDDIQNLIDVFQHNDFEFKLFFKEPGFEARRFVWARPSGRVFVRNPRTPFMPQFKVRLKLADPRTYREGANTALLQDYDAGGGGAEYDVTEYGREYSVDTSSQVTVRNDGNARSWPVIQFFGPTTGTVTQVTLTNVTTGNAVVFDTTILTGQTLTADMEAIEVVRSSETPAVRLGATNKYAEWAQPREPLYLVPGDNILRFEITGGTSTDGTASITYRDTWL